MQGKQRCGWHWLIEQPPHIQEAYAAGRLQRVGDAEHRARVSPDEWPEGERWCSGCQTFVPLWYCQGSRCRACNGRAAFAAHILKTYGLSIEDYDAMFALQGQRCYICQRVARSKRLAVDHDHNTGQVRGLLCADSERGCNHAILGNIADIAMARRIVEYLEDPPFRRLGRGEVRDRSDEVRIPGLRRPIKVDPSIKPLPPPF
jgi:hypothetical protein